MSQNIICCKMHGLTLIEFLMAIFIGTFILQLAGQLYLSLYATFNAQHTIMQVIHHTDKLSRLFQAELRATTHIGGCKKLTEDLTIHPYNNYALLPAISLSFPEVLTLRHASKRFITLAEAMHDKHSLTLSKKFNIKTGDIMLIANCHVGEIFVVKAIYQRNNKFIVVPQAPFKHNYTQLSELAFLEENSFFIRNNSLMVKNIKNKTMEIMPNVLALKTSLDYAENKIIGVSMAYKFKTAGLIKDGYIYVARN